MEDSRGLEELLVTPVEYSFSPLLSSSLLVFESGMGHYDCCLQMLAATTEMMD